MARTIEATNYPRYKFREGPPIKLSWSAIFGGVVSALGIWALLYALGLALGLSAINPDNPESAKPSGLFAGLWSLLVPLIALFIGGAIAGRGAGLIHRGGGAIHGLVMWGVTTVGGAFLVGNLLGSALGGIADLGGGALRGGMQVGQRMDFGLNAEDAIAPINERLQAEGKPAITADQIENASREVMRDAVREGKVDRESLISAISSETQLSRQDSEEIAARVESQYDSAKDKVATGALKAADATGKAFWGVFGALFFGMLSAILGGIFGVSRRQQRETGMSGVGPTVIVEETHSSGYPRDPLHQ